MDPQLTFFGLRAYRAPQRSTDLVERSTNLLRYLKLSGDFEKNNENFGILEEMAIPQHFGCGVAQKRSGWYWGNSLISLPRGFSKEMARWASWTNFFLFFSTSPSSCGYPGSLVCRDSTSGWTCNIKYSAGHLEVVRVVHFTACFLTENNISL